MLCVCKQISSQEISKRAKKRTIQSSKGFVESRLVGFVVAYCGCISAVNCLYEDDAVACFADFYCMILWTILNKR